MSDSQALRRQIERAVAYIEALDEKQRRELERSGFMRAARPPVRSPARTSLPTKPPPAPADIPKMRAASHSFRAQRDEAHAAIRELLALNDAVTAELRDVMETIKWMDGSCDDASEWPALVNRAHAWLEANP